MATYKKQLKDQNGDNIIPALGTATVTSTNIDWSTINPYNYSSSEQVVGTWIDGRNVYRKVLTGTTSNTANENPYHNISNLYAILEISGSILMTNGEIQPIQRVVTDNISGYGIGLGDFNYYGGSGRFILQHPASGYQGRPYIIIITYIKTS